MNIYLIIMFAAVAAGFVIAASMSIGAYKEYTGNDLIRKTHDEKFLKNKFVVLVGYVSSKIFYAAVIASVPMINSIGYERVKIPFIIFGAAAFVSMLLQGAVIKKDTLAGALDKTELYNKTILKIGLCEVIAIIPLIYLFGILQ